MDKGFEQSEKMLNELEARLHKEYAQASKEMAEKVDKYFARFEAENAKMEQAVKDGRKSAKEYNEWRMRKMATGKRYIEMRNTLAADLTNADRIAMKMVNNTLPDVYALNMNYGTYKIEMDSKINTSFTLYNHAAVENLIKNNPQLLPSPKVDIPKDLRWNQQHIQSAITQGILQGKSIPDIAKNLQNVVGMDERAAIRNARTAMTGAQNAGRLDSMKRAAARGVGLKKGWMATLDHVTRDSHVDLDGEVQELDKPFSNGLMYPGGIGEPAEVYNCRCRLTHEYDKYKTDWSNPAIRNTEKLGNMSYQEWKDKHKAKIVAKSATKATMEKAKESVKAVEPIAHTEAYEKLIKNIHGGIEYREVENLTQELTDAEIIDKIGGGDLTKGSCSSLTYAYIGNKCGYDVYDFRDGASRNFFASRNEQMMRDLDGIEKQVFIVQKESSEIAKKLKELNLPYGEEYRLSCGRHAAIIRNTENGYQYLELQKATGNGWKSFTERERLKITGFVDGKAQYETYTEKCTMADTLKNRFGCRVTKSNMPMFENGKLKLDENGLIMYGSEMDLTKVSSYKDSAEFKELLGYINTAPDKQHKGAKGYAK